MRLLSFIVVLHIHTICAQQPLVCSTTPNPKSIDLDFEAFKKQYQSNNKSTSTIYLPVKLHFTKRQDNTTEFMSLHKVVDEFAKANAKFALVGFQFFLADNVNYIINNDMDEFDSYFLTNVGTYNVNNAINTFYINSGVTAGGASNFPSSLASNNWQFIMNNSWQQGETLIHEFGHYFNLYHTFETSTGYEKVTRTTGANCSTAGDLLCDTPADNGFFYNKATCTYTGTYTDRNGALYTPMVENYMSYYTTCFQTFTPGQHTRMQEGHAYRLYLIDRYGKEYNFSAPQNNTILPVTGLTANYQDGRIKISWNDTNAQEMGYFIERSTSATTGFEFVGGVGKDSTYYYDYSFLPNTTYYYRITAANNTSINAISASVSTSQNAYCIPRTFSDFNQFIDTLSVSSNNTPYFQNSSTLNGTYNDFSHLKIPTLKGMTFNLRMHFKLGNGNGIKIWIDLNKNHDFETNEVIYVRNSISSAATLTPSFQIPNMLTNGLYRMRIRHINANNISDIDNLNACEKYGGWGETQDYSLEVFDTLTSISSNNWQLPATWQWGIVPAFDISPKILNGHTVNVNNAGNNAKTINLEGNLNFVNGSILNVNN